MRSTSSRPWKPRASLPHRAVRVTFPFINSHYSGRPGLLHGFLERVAVPFSNKSIWEVEVTSLKISARKFIRDEEGAALAEYGILVAFIAIVAITAVTFFGSKISAKFSSLATSFS